MSSEKSEFQKSGEGFARGVWHFLKGMAISLFGALFGILRNFYKDVWSAWEKRDFDRLIGVLFALIVVGWITYNSVADLYRGIERRWHSDWYETQFLASYENEAMTFFKLYSRRFAERDCDFMSKVGVDEGMYDKYGRTKYDIYNCENYYNGIKFKFMLPFDMEPMIESVSKQRIRGKMVVLQLSEDNRYSVGAQYFELWRVPGDMWRLNASSKEGSKKIPIELIPQ